MKKNYLPILSVMALCTFAFLHWWRNRVPEIVIEPPAQLPKKIEEINKKIPKKISSSNKVKVVKKSNPKKEDQKVISLNKPPSKLEVLPEDEIAIHLQNTNGDLIITSVTVVDNLIIAHGDIIVGTITDMDEFLERANTGEPIILPLPKLWENGIIPYEIDGNLPNKDQIELAIQDINQKTNVKWKERDDEQDYVKFVPGSLHCYSPLGKLGGKQEISLSQSCSAGSIKHEMLHTMGLLHEQNREDRDKYIRILWENIDTKNHLQFQKIKTGLIDLENHFFDFKSIMLYTQSAFSKYPGDFTIVKVDGDTYYPSRDSLSSGDLKKLRELYPNQKN